MDIYPVSQSAYYQHIGTKNGQIAQEVGTELLAVIGGTACTYHIDDMQAVEIGVSFKEKYNRRILTFAQAGRVSSSFNVRQERRFFSTNSISCSARRKAAGQSRAVTTPGFTPGMISGSSFRRLNTSAALPIPSIKRFAPICPIPGQSVRAMLQIRSSLFIPPQITQIHTD